MTFRDAPPLVPELAVTDLTASLGFWCGPCGFAPDPRRAAPGFAYLTRGEAHVMLEQGEPERDWFGSELARPFGRGSHLRVLVDDLEPVLAGMRSHGIALLHGPAEARYGVPGHEVHVRQIVVADPDGYVVRFQEMLDDASEAGTTGS